MTNFGDFVVNLLKIFFGAIWKIISWPFRALFQLFNFPAYIEVFATYCGGFNFIAWVLAIIIYILLLAAIGAIGNGVNRAINYKITMANYNEQNNAANAQTNFSRVRMGLIDGGRGTEN